MQLYSDHRDDAPAETGWDKDNVLGMGFRSNYIFVSFAPKRGDRSPSRSARSQIKTRGGIGEKKQASAIQG